MTIFDGSELVWGQAGIPAEEGISSGQIGALESRITALEGTAAVTAYAQLDDVDVTNLASGSVAIYDGSDWVMEPAWEVAGGFTITVMLGDGANVLTSSEPAVIFAAPPFASTLVGFEVYSTVSGSVSCATARAAAGSASFSNIHASAPVSLSAAQVRVDTSLTGWTTAINAHDKIRTTITGSPSSVILLAVAYRFVRGQ